MINTNCEATRFSICVIVCSNQEARWMADRWKTEGDVGRRDKRESERGTRRSNNSSEMCSRLSTSVRCSRDRSRGGVDASVTVGERRRTSLCMRAGLQRWPTQKAYRRWRRRRGNYWRRSVDVACRVPNPATGLLTSPTYTVLSQRPGWHTHTHTMHTA